MKLSYNGGGVVNCRGAVKAYKKVRYKYKFAVDSPAFIRRQAEKGVLERIIIGKVLIGNNNYTQYQENVMYEDKLKSLYNERELCNETEANQIINSLSFVAPLNIASIKKQEPVGKIQSVTPLFPVGTTVFSKRKAELGSLEKIVIFDVLQKNNSYTSNQDNILYIDKLKSLFSEKELVSESDAKNLALAYWTKRRSIIVDEIVQEIAPQ
jgi:hypothetical protein